MFNLPLDLPEFFIWWLSKMPKKILMIFKRILVFINNEFGFTLNLRLIFTPIYGDYTIVGRGVGFVFRIMEIFAGLVFTIAALICLIISPFVWWSLPILLTYFLNILVLPLFIGVFFWWKFQTKDTPAKTSMSVKENDIDKCFRPKALDMAEFICSQNTDGLRDLVKTPDLKFLLKKAELLNNEFLQKLMDARTINVANIKKSAYEYAKEHNTRYVELEQIFLSTLANIPKIDILLSTYGTSLKSLDQTVSWVLSQREELSKKHFWQEAYEMPKMGGIGRAMTGRVTPGLDAISEDFTYKAKYTKNARYVIHREEMKEIAEILSGSKVNVLIVGEPGSGKTSMMLNLAYQIVRGTGYEALKFKRIVSLQTGALISGAKTSGELAQKLRKAMEDVETSGDIILFIDEIHNLVSGVSNENAEIASVYSILEPYLSSGKIQFVGTTNVENYRKYIEPNGSFSRLFNIVDIPPSTKEETLEVIKVIAVELEQKYGIFVTMPALQKIVDLSDKLIQERVFPDKAVDILNRTTTMVARSTKELTAEDVAKEVSIVTKIPVASITQEESEKLLNIETSMKERVIGQDEAIKLISSALKRARAGMRNDSKPIASFLFVGTTGVGKTETAKALARTFFGDEKRMIRLDMSEYQQIDSIDKLIGTPDSKTKGVLTEAVRTNPFSLILLDEIEKAYSSILLAFLQVLDDGRLTDSTGKVVNFTNTIIIATSNVGTRGIQSIFESGGTFDLMKESAMKEVRDKFAPEFLNRFTGIIVFRPLSVDHVRKIADIMLNSVRKLADDKGIKITFKPEVIEELIKRGYNPQWGARPLARVIEDTVESYLATKMLAKQIKMGDEVELGMEVFEE